MFQYDKIIRANPVEITELNEEERALYIRLLQDYNHLIDGIRNEKVILKKHMVDMTKEGVRLINFFVYRKKEKMFFYKQLIEDINDDINSQKEQAAQGEKVKDKMQKELTLEETFEGLEVNEHEQKESIPEEEHNNAPEIDKDSNKELIEEESKEEQPEKEVEDDEEDKAEDDKEMQEQTDIKGSLEERLAAMGISEDMVTEIIYNSIINDFDLSEEEVGKTKIYKYLDAHNDMNDISLITEEIIKLLFHAENGEEQALNHDITEYEEAVGKYIKNTYHYTEILLSLCKEGTSTFEVNSVRNIQDLIQYSQEMVSAPNYEDMNTPYDSADEMEAKLKYEKSKIEASQMRYFSLS